MFYSIFYKFYNAPKNIPWIRKNDVANAVFCGKTLFYALILLCSTTFLLNFEEMNPVLCLFCFRPQHLAQRRTPGT